MPVAPPIPEFSALCVDKSAEVSVPILTSQGLRLRIETLEAQRKEAVQRLVDLQRIADGALRLPPEAESVEIGKTEAVKAAHQELMSLNKKQHELEIAFAKASARENLESQLQTACGGCLQYKQKVIAQRAEEDHQFEALRAEMAASAAELELGKREARAAVVADADRQRAEEARVRLVQAQTAELEELKRRANDHKDALRALRLRATELAQQSQSLMIAQQDLNLKYKNIGEGCIKGFSDLDAMQQIVSAADSSVKSGEEGTRRGAAEIMQLRKGLEEIRMAVAEVSDSAQGIAPMAEERLRNGEMQIAELTEAFKSVEGKHADLDVQMRNNVERVDNIEKEVELVKTWTWVSS